MKRSGLILIICLITAYSFSDYTLTRGPNSGEIYFIGLTNTGEGIYYSTNFGETATCQDFGSLFYGSICADRTEGVLYLVAYFEHLYISTNYGITGSWEFRNSNMAQQINSGRIEGEIFSAYTKHSEDFGHIFNIHSNNGIYGDKKNAEIDANNLNIGYALTHNLNVLDTLYMFITYDKFENLEIVKKFNFIWSEAIELSRGTNSGEIYLFNHTRGIIMLSNDFASTWDTISTVNFSNIYGLSLTGGRSDGEIYILYNFVNMGWNNAHTYIYHSIDYGKTFEVFHPFAKGNEPVLANYSTVEKEVQLTTAVEFSNFSIGNVIEYQWDFENDGIIDSYDEFPTHMYQDTGYYSVKLSVVGQDSTNTFIKENYIHVIDTITSNPDLKYPSLNIYPNPFTDKITIETRSDYKRIEIYDLNGKGHFVKSIDKGNKTEIIDLKKLEKGIYILKIKTEGQELTKKILKI